MESNKDASIRVFSTLGCLIQSSLTIKSCFFHGDRLWVYLSHSQHTHAHHSLTHTHTFTHSLTHTYTYTRTLYISLYQAHTHTNSISLFHCYSLSHFLSNSVDIEREREVDVLIPSVNVWSLWPKKPTLSHPHPFRRQFIRRQKRNQNKKEDKVVSKYVKLN